VAARNCGAIANNRSDCDTKI